MNHPVELLAPAGSIETLKTAFLYGADAVYCGGESFGLRAKARNFTREALAEAARYAHERGKKLYITLNILAHDEDLEGLTDYLLFLREIAVDALIIADPGILLLAREKVPEIPVHLSTQASAMNSAAFRFWHERGVSRIVAARELSLGELSKIRGEIPKSLQIEVFCHGAMCMAISGRCLLSSFLTGRDANRGSCSHPCRWSYAVSEETRPGEYFPVEEAAEGSHIFSSKDLCTAAMLPELIETGICSLKVEGRMKTPLYVAQVIRVYREALTDLSISKDRYESRKEEYLAALKKVSHRGYTEGFYKTGQIGPEDMAYGEMGYEKAWELAGKVIACENGKLIVEQRGKFSIGETLMLLLPGSLESAPFTVESIRNAAGEAVESAPHAQEIVTLKSREELALNVSAGTMIAKIVSEGE